MSRVDLGVFARRLALAHEATVPIFGAGVSNMAGRSNLHARVQRRLPLKTTILVGVVLLASIALLAAPRTKAGRSSKQSDSLPRSNGAPGNLAIVSLETLSLKNAAGMERHLVQALVANQSELDLPTPWRLELFGAGSESSLAECHGDALPRQRVALCEIWLAGGVLSHGAEFEARLDREIKEFDRWDGDPASDRYRTTVRTSAEGGPVLRIASWDVRPRVLHGRGEAQFRFSVEGSHLVWLLADGEAPRLLGGHPSDGLIAGKSSVRLSTSGPVTLVARNSHGSFVYEAIPVMNTYDEEEEAWSAELPDAAAEIGRAHLLSDGVVEVDADLLVLEHLNAHLAAKDWSAALQDLQFEAARRLQPRPASALNPEALRRD